jgi:hypothetical protein
MGEYVDKNGNTKRGMLGGWWGQVDASPLLKAVGLTVYADEGRESDENTLFDALGKAGLIRRKLLGGRPPQFRWQDPDAVRERNNEPSGDALSVLKGLLGDRE